MSTNETVEVVERLYAALQADDVTGVLELCAPDVEWQYPAADLIRYGGLWRGPAGIERFLELHDELEEIVAFEPAAPIVDGQRAAVLGVFRGRSLQTDRSWETRFVHVITVRDGRVERFEAFFDTAAAMEAHRR